MYLNVDPLNPAGRPDPAMLRSLGFDGVRVVLRPGIEEYLQLCWAEGLSVLGVIARESIEARPLAWYMRYMLPDLLQLGNEPDCEGASSWTMDPYQYAMFWREAIPLVPPEVPIVTAGLASGNAWWLDEVKHELVRCSGVAVHPYAKQAGDARALLRVYRDLYGLPLFVTEWNRPAIEIGGFAAMLREEAAGSAWFCATSGMVPGFGLLDDPAKLEAMKEVLTVFEDEAKAIELLQRQQNLTLHLIGRMLEGRWDAPTHGADSAEALLKSFHPTEFNQYTAVPFPKA